MNDNTPNTEIIEETAWESLTDQEIIDKLESDNSNKHPIIDPLMLIEVNPATVNPYSANKDHPGQLSNEQQEQIADIFEKQIHSEDPDKDLQTVVMEYLKHQTKKPAGEPPEIPKEERDAILEYYKSGATGEKPANADRFTLCTTSYTTSWRKAKAEGAKATHKKQHLKDNDLIAWISGPAAKWIKEDRHIVEKIGNIQRDCISAAAKVSLGYSLNEIEENDITFDFDNVLFYSSISTFVNALFQKKFDEIKDEYENAEQIPAYYVPPSDDICLFPVDKFNWTVWHGIPANVTADIKLEPARKGNAIKIGSFRASKELTEKHFNAYRAIYDFWRNGQYEFTTRQLYRKIHKGVEPSADNLEDLQKLVTDLLETTIYFNDSGIAREKGFTMYREGIRQLLNGAIYNSRAFFNGELVESYISLSKTDPPFLMHYAYTLDQYTYFPAAILNPPSSKTNFILGVNHYIDDKVAHGRRRAKRNKSKRAEMKFKWTTLFDYLGITDRREKSRARKYARNHIEYCIKYNLLSSYKESGPNYTDTVTLICTYTEPAQIGPTSNAQISKN